MSGPQTLCVDVGGTAIRAALLAPNATDAGDRIRIATPYPFAPADLVALVSTFVADLGPPDRISVAFPGMVRQGRVLTAPFFVRRGGPGTARAEDLAEAWEGCDLAGLLRDLSLIHI